MLASTAVQPIRGLIARATWTRSLSTSPVLQRLPASPSSSSRSSSFTSTQHRSNRSNSSFPSTNSRRSPTRSSQFNNSRSKSPAAASTSDVSLPHLLERLQKVLSQNWSASNKDHHLLQRYARDLGLNTNDLLKLAHRFEKELNECLRARKKESQQHGSWNRVESEEEGDISRLVDRDELKRIKTDYITDGPSTLQDACLRLFVHWCAAQPKPSAIHSSMNKTMIKLQQLSEMSDRRYPGEAYPDTRALRRKIILHVGPTNSGKTYSALIALSKARTGAYAGPLRLLAHEVFSRFNQGKIGELKSPIACNLLTGEEQRIVHEDAGLVSCTVEMFPIGQRLDVGVVDEIQMIADGQRGSAWTDVVVGANCKVLHLCGEESVVDLVTNLANEMGDELIVKRYSRLSPLVVAQQSLQGDLSKIRKGDCLVTFSRNNIFAFKKSIEEKTGLKVAVAYGGLPPEVREEQARMFNDGGYDVLVASDAIGMGLNLKVRRIVFETVHKWDGKAEIQLPTPQIKQIAGRAGRYGVHGTSSPSGPDDSPAEFVSADVVGEATCLEEADMEVLREAMATPTIEVKQASLSPRSETFAAIQSLLPQRTTFSKIFRLVEILSRTNGKLFKVSTGRDSHKIFDAIEHIHPLSCQERLLFGKAPVNLRDNNVVGALTHFAEMFAAGEPIMMERWKLDSGIQDALERVEGVKAQKKGWTPSAQIGPAVIYNSHFLMKLESFHRCLTLYLWLSYREWPIFQDRENARLLRKEIESAIDFVLAGMKVERVSRRSKRHQRFIDLGSRPEALMMLESEQATAP